MHIRCAYCNSFIFEKFTEYKLHLKVYHNKTLYMTSLLCGQDGCRLQFSRFQTLRDHIIHHHKRESTISETTENSCLLEGDITMESEDGISDEPEPQPETNRVDCCDKFLQDSVNSQGIFRDAALFTAKLRSNLKIPLSSVVDIVQNCEELMSPAATAVMNDIQSVAREYNIPQDRVANIVQVLDVVAKPFKGIATEWKQCKYYEQSGCYVEPQSFFIDSYLVPAQGETSCKIEKITGEYVCLTKVLKKFLTLPGVMQHVTSHLNQDFEHGVISDFCHGKLWRNHPVRLQHLSESKTIVIPVFDFYDDLETANPLGSHSVVHKIGVKYTVMKGCSPVVSSKLENIFLNTIFKTAARTSKDIFAIYFDEMAKLETEGFTLLMENGEMWKVYVVVVQVIGDNLGLNGLLGYVESFSASYPCRLCKTLRSDFSTTFVECPDLLRTRISYQADVLLQDPSLTGIKQPCAYNVLPSYHVADNVYCDIMHDVTEGVCRYVVAGVLNYLIFDKNYFTLDTLNGRKMSFKFDHSSVPPDITAEAVKKANLSLSAIEMLNLVLSLTFLVGDLVPEGDSGWEVYLQLRQIILYCCGLTFTTEELGYFETIIAEFLQEYVTVFHGTLTLKFHNLTHYPRVIEMLGPLYHNWVMRCEAKHAALKTIAHTAGNFKNICRTLAVRHQLQQAERFLSQRGFEELDSFELPQCKFSAIVLSDLVDGRHVSTLLGNYGLYRELYTAECVTVCSVCYRLGDILPYISDYSELHTDFLQIVTIYVTDDMECILLCSKLSGVLLNHHYQAYEVVESGAVVPLNVKELQQLPSPWPLKVRTVYKSSYVSLRHKL